jgi:AcrR family transcriptional regulator
MPREAIATRERIPRHTAALLARGCQRVDGGHCHEAGVSWRCTQFRNKEEIFRSLAQQLQDDAMTRATQALEGTSPIADRVRSAIEEKSLRFVEIAYSSPHGNELMDETNRLCGDLVAEMEGRFQEQLTRVFRRAAQAGEIDLGAVSLSAVETAQLLLRSVRGLKGPGIAVEDYRGGRRSCAHVPAFARVRATSGPRLRAV